MYFRSDGTDINKSCPTPDKLQRELDTLFADETRNVAEILLQEEAHLISVRGLCEMLF